MPVATPGGMMKVLVIEDSNDVAVVIQMLLKSAGHQPLLASDAASAIELCRRIRPDFVLTDIGLPGMDGYDLAVRLRRRVWAEWRTDLGSELLSRQCRAPSRSRHYRPYR